MSEAKSQIVPAFFIVHAANADEADLAAIEQRDKLTLIGGPLLYLDEGIPTVPAVEIEEYTSILDHYPRADLLQAVLGHKNPVEEAAKLAEQVAMLQHWLSVQTTWVEASLKCDQHLWDGDQREAATHGCKKSRELLAKLQPAAKCAGPSPF